MVKLRLRNAVWAQQRRAAIDSGSRDAVIGLQVRGLGADFARGTVLTAAALLVFAPLGDLAITHWSIDARLSRAFVVTVATSVTAAAAWKIFHGTAGARWLWVAGLAMGLAIMWGR